MYRMDHAYQASPQLARQRRESVEAPSEYFREHIYTTFQDDWVAFRSADQMNWRRLMWANDFPHSDSTWPWSQQMLARHAEGIPRDTLEKILFRNVAALYDIDLATIEQGKADLAPAAAGADAVRGYNASDVKNAGRLADLPSAAAPTSFLLMEDAPVR